MEPNRDEPRWRELRGALKTLCTRGARLWWLREPPSKPLLSLRIVRAKAIELKDRDEHTPSTLETHRSDGRAEAAVTVLRECIAPFRDTPDGRLLWIVMDLDRRRTEETAKQRRAAAGREFRGRDGRPVGESAIRQIYEPAALDRLTDALILREDGFPGNDAGGG